MNIGCTYFAKMYYKATTVDKKDLNKVMSTKLMDEEIIFEPVIRTLSVSKLENEFDLLKIILIKKPKSKEVDYKLQLDLVSEKFSIKDKLDKANIILNILEDKSLLVEESFKKSKVKIKKLKKKNAFRFTKEISSNTFKSVSNAFKMHFDNNSYTVFNVDVSLSKKEKGKED